MCNVCDGTGIEYVQIEMPDGYGGVDYAEEARPCSECS